MSEETEKESPYQMKGIPVNAYLIETGEFRWIPKTQACTNKEKARQILEVLKKMPDDRQRVWASRLDIEQTKTKCPVIRKEADLCREFDEYCSAYDLHKSDLNSKRREKNE